jgi:hypothetical protein
VVMAPKGTVTFGASIMEDVSGLLCGGSGTFSSLGGNAANSTATSCGFGSTDLIYSLSMSPALDALDYLGGLTRVHDIPAGHAAVEEGLCLDSVDQRVLSRPVGLECEPGAVERRP